jgi:NAD(P)-dependent dehydrogenase (short-subunit alcohol dehydrogenase family)
MAVTLCVSQRRPNYGHEVRTRVGGPDRTALITGGASGIGLALARALADTGTRVVITDVDEDALERAAAKLRAFGSAGRVVARVLDVRDEAAFASLACDVIDGSGAIDLLFNNAGISIGGPTHEMSGAHWAGVVDVNLRGVVNGILAVYPHMVERRRGHIVNTASGAGLVGPPFVAAYAATKYAVVGLSTALRPEAALHGVKVTVLCPGSVETPILDRRPSDDLPPTASAPVTAREYLTLARQKPMSADRFARKALKGAARNRLIVVAPAAARPLWYLHRVSPALTQPLLRALASRVNRDLVRPR